MIVHIGYITVIVTLVIVQHFERENFYDRLTGAEDKKTENKSKISMKSAHRRVIEKWRDTRGDR